MSNTIERCIYRVAVNKDDQYEDLGFIGTTLQCMTIHLSEYVKTAGICFNKNIKQFELLINEKWFDGLLEDKNRIAVLVHELNHIFFKHVFIPQEIILSHNKTRMNISMDLVINQLIKNLPEECFTIEKIKDKNGKKFPSNLTFEEYYHLLDGSTMEIPDCSGKHSDDKNGPKCDGSCTGKNGDKKPGKKGTREVSVSDYYEEKPFDAHQWSEAEQQEALEATRDLIKRSMQKASFSGTKVPSYVQDCLDNVNTTLGKIDYKNLLLKALRQSLPSKDIRKTWKRPSRRLGDIAKGNIVGLMPKLQCHIDTSGSISIIEANEFLAVTNNFMTVGVSKADLYLWHTTIYHHEKIKKNFKILPDKFQSGGTDLNPTIQHLHKTKPDLAIIITDGYYGEVNLPKGFNTPIVFVISKQGAKDHPLCKYGVSVSY